MSKTTLVFSCSHADPSASNERFDWLGKFIYDLKPDMVIDLGDGADMKSLNSYDKGKAQAIVAQNYEEDINVYNDSQERLRHQFRYHKRGKPTWIGFEGNHEHRIKTALTYDPRLEGSKYGISFSHLQTNHWFKEYHEYSNSAPSVATYDGVDYAHFFAPGNSGRAIAGIHHAYGLVVCLQLVVIAIYVLCILRMVRVFLGLRGLLSAATKEKKNLGLVKGTSSGGKVWSLSVK